MKEYRDASGRLTIDLTDNDQQFNMFVSRLEKNCKARLTQKLDGLEQRYWDFEIDDVTFVLHSDPMMGVSIHVEDGSNEDLLRFVATKCFEE
jgi:hypothetical protein